MSTTDILDIIKKVKAESTAGAFQPAEEKSLVYSQDQSGAFLDPESLTPADNDVISLFKKVKQGSVETPPALEVSKTPAETEAAAKQNLATRNEFMRGLYRGIDTTQAAFYGGLGMYSAAMGDTEAADRRFQQYQEQMRQASENPATVDQFFSTDPKKGAFGSVGNFGTWVAGTGGSLIPSVVEAGAAGITGAAIGGALFPAPDPGDVVTVPAGFIGGVFGRAAIKKAMAEAAQKYVEKGVAKEVADRMGRQAVNNVLAKRVGGLAAAQQITALQEGGGMYAEGREAGYDNPLSAMALGQASGLSEVALGNMPLVVRKFLGRGKTGEAIKNADPRAAAGYIWDAVKNTGEEGVQEGFQEFLGSVNETINEPEKKLLTKENFMQWAEASAAGALAGAGFGAAGAASSALQDRAERLKKLKEKGFISEEDATEAGIEGNSRRERMANVESEINRIEQEIQVQDTPDPEIASMIDGMISEGESDDEFVRQQAGSPAPQAPQVEAPITPTPLYEVAGDENMVARVWPNPQGFLVNLTDIDSGEVFPTANIFPTFEQAKQHADTVRLPQQPQAAPEPIDTFTEYANAWSQNLARSRGTEPKPLQARTIQSLRETIDGHADYAIKMGRSTAFVTDNPTLDALMMREIQKAVQAKGYQVDDVKQTTEGGTNYIGFNVIGSPQQAPQVTPPTAGDPFTEGEPQPPAAQNPFEPGVLPPQGEIPDASAIRSPQEEVRQEEGGADLRGSGQEQVRTQPESQESPAQAEIQVGSIYEPRRLSEQERQMFDESRKAAAESQPTERPIPDEPPLASGMTRLYHGSAEKGRLTGSAWYSTDRQYAANYRDNAELQYIDVPTDWVNQQIDPDNYGQTVDKGFTLNVQLDSSDVGSRKVLLGQAEGAAQDEPLSIDPATVSDEESVDEMRKRGMSEDEIQDVESSRNYFNVVGDPGKASDKDLNRAYGFSNILISHYERKGQDDMAESIRREQEAMKREIKDRNERQDAAEDENAEMDEMVRAEFEAQMRSRQAAPSEKKGKKRKKPRSLRKDKPPTATEQARDAVRKKKADLYQQFKDEFKNKPPSGLDAKLAKIAVEIAIAEIEDGVLTFAAFVENVSTNFAADAIDEIKPYFESAWRVAHSLDLTKDPGGKFDDVLKGKAEGDKEVAPRDKKPVEEKGKPAKPAPAESDTDKTLRQAGLKVEQLPDGTWQITGNTYENSKEIGDAKREVPDLKGWWDPRLKRWTFKRDPRREIADRIASRATRDEPVDDAGSDEQMAREDARREQDAIPDIQRSGEDYVASVDQSTKDLVARGLKFGMTQEVVDNQIEDIGRVVVAAEENLPMFVIGSAPGTGKTFVLGGVIRELRRRGFKKFVYVTQNENLISQVQGNLADYGLEGVEFTTYAKSREKPLDTSGAVLLLDEAHTAKNDDRETGKKISRMVKASTFTVYATATPFENVSEAEYLGYSGIFDGLSVEFTRPSNNPNRPFRNTLSGFDAWAWMFGAKVFFVKQTDYKGDTYMVPVVWWDKHQTAEEDQFAANEWLKKRGVYVQRPMSLPAGTVKSEMRSVEADPYWADISNRVVDIYDEAESQSESNQEKGQIKAHKETVLKRLLELAKVDAAIARTKEIIGEGRKEDPQVIIFVNYKSDLDLGTFALSKPYRDHYKIKGKEAKRRYKPSEMDEMMRGWYQAKALAKHTGDDAGPPPFAPFIHKIAMVMDEAGLLENFPSVIDKIMDAFPGQAVEFSGRSGSENADNLAKWKNNEAKLIVATMHKGGTGLSFHDTTGKMPSRYQVNMTLPWSGTQVEQVSGRLARYGTAKPVNIEWIFANNIPFDRRLSKTVGSRMRSMSAAVQGAKSGDAKRIMDFDFTEDQQAEMESPWLNASVEDENRWAGTTVSVSPKGKEEGYEGTVVRVLNKGETIEIQRDGFDSSTRVPAERVSIISLVDDKAGTSAEQADKAAKILSDMESNQEKLRQDKKRREGEKFADWVKAFEGSPREVTAAKDLFRKDTEKARENGVSDERLFEIIDNGVAVGVFTPQEASDLKARVNRELAGVEGVSPYSESSPESQQRRKDIGEAWSDMRSYYQLNPESTIEDGLRNMIDGFVSGDSKSPRITGNPDGKAYEYTGGDKRLNAIRKRAQTIANKTGAVQAIVVVDNKARTSIPAHAVIVSSPGFVGSEYNPQDSKHFAWVNSLTKLYPEMIVDVIVPSEEKIGKKSVGASELKPRDRFVDSNGQTWEVFSSRGGVVIAHPVVDGKPQVNRDSQASFAVTDAAKSRHPEYKTDIVSVTKWKGEEEVPASKETQEDEEAKPGGGEQADQGSVEQDRGEISRYGVKGNSTSVITADKETRRATYYAVEAGDLIPSHDARRNFAKNKGALENERPYEDPKEGAESRQMVRDVASVGPKIKLVTSDTMSPTDGPPVVDQSGRVLGGNARAMGMQLAYTMEGADRLREHMRSEGAKFGIPQEQLDALKEPVIIRVLDDLFDEKNISALLNEPLTAAKSQATVAVSQAKRLSEKTISLIAGIMSTEEEPSIREVMASPKQSTRIIQAIVSDGAWSDKDIGVYVNASTGDLTAEGKIAIENMLVARVIPDISILGDVAPSIKQKIVAAIGPLTQGMADKRHGQQLLSDILEAIKAYDGYVAEKKQNSLQSYFMDQGRLFDPPPGYMNYSVAGFVYAFAEFTQTKFRNAMRDLMESLDIGERTPSLFGDDVTYDNVKDAVKNVIQPPLSSGPTTFYQLDNNLRSLPDQLYQTAPDVNENMWSDALNLSIAAQDAGIKSLRDFVAYSVKTIGRDRTLQVSRFLRLAAEVAGMDGVQQAAAVSGITRDQVVTMAKRAFSEVLSEDQIETGVTIEDITAFGRNEIGFAPYGTPVPGQAMAQEDFDQPSGYKFNESEYRPAVVSYARDKWGEKIAPNGKPTWQNFVRWFGDSKVVDKDGKPLVVYHGGRRTIDNDIVRTPFFYMTANRSEAEYWAGENGRVHEVYLKFTKPYRDSQHDDRFMDMEERAQDYDWDDPEFAEELREVTREAVSRMNELKGQGYNSIVMQGEADENYDNFIAFDPTQIKSATGNRGTFDPNNPNMLYQEEAKSHLRDEQPATYRVLDEGEVPEKTRRVYKLMKRYKSRPGLLYPLFVKAQEGGFKRGEWYAAEVKSPRISNKDLAKRPGIHSVDLPIFAQGKPSAKGQDRVWVEVEIPDISAETQAESDGSPRLPNGMRTGITDRLIGTKEAYDYKTNPNAAGANAWPIAGSMKIIRVLSDADVDQVLREAGKEEWVASSLSGESQEEASRWNMLYQQEEAPRWYLKSRKLIQDKMGPKATSEQVLGMLRKNGVNDEELYWSGLEELLGSKQAVTKEEVISAIANGIRVEEVTLGVQPNRYANMNRQQLIDAYINEIGYDPEEGEPESISTEDIRRNLEENFAEVKQRNTKFKKYTLPGGENYTELLLTIPEVDRYKELVEAGYKAVRRDGYWQIVRGDGVGVGSGRGNTEEEALRSYAEVAEGGNAKEVSKSYRSAHWDEPNVVAHIRFNERTDTDGKRVLFIEEIQSDWHQEGRKKGYTRKIFTPVNRRSKYPGPSFDTKEEAEAWVAKLPESMQKNIDISISEEPGTPDAPFKKSWPALAMKRAIQYAAENGFDRIAWTNGEQQAGRYDLSKQVDRIVVAPRANVLSDEATKEQSKSVTIELIGGSAPRLGVNGEGIIDNVRNAQGMEDALGKPLDEVIGKELAEKVMQAERATFEGVDLKVGGSGMKAFYDKMLPSETNKLIKKFGSKVEMISVLTEDRVTYDQVQAAERRRDWAEAERLSAIFERQELGRGDDDIQGEFSGSPQMGFDITPAMRESAMQYGQTLFQTQPKGKVVKGWTKFISAHRALIGATNKADFSTFIHEFFHPMRLFLLDRSVPAEKRADITDEEIEALEKASGAGSFVNGKWVTKWGVKAEEKAAKMWEQYWYEGESPNSVLDSLFQKISRWMREIYSGVQEITGTPLPKEIRDLFDKLVQRGLPADQRGGKGAEPVSRGEPVLRPANPVTSIRNEVANQIALLRGSPGLVEPEAQTMDEWLEEASNRLRQDPTLGDRLVKELDADPTGPDQIDTAVLQMHYRGLNNALYAAQDRLFTAKDRKDSVAAAKALKEVDAITNSLEEMERVDKKIGTLQARSFVARKITLYADFSPAALLRRGRAANGGERLNEEQKRQIAELAAELAKVQGDLAKAEQVIADLQRQDGVRQVVDDDIKKAPKTKTKSEPRQKAATAVQSFVKKFSSIFKPKGGSDTLMQTEDERMSEEAESVVMAYVEAGVFSYGELLANLRKEIGGELPVQAQAAFATAWEKIKAQGEIPIPMVNPGDVEGLTRIAREIQMAIIESGIVTADQEDRAEVVLDAVWRSLQEIDPEITERQTMDALSGYGQFTPISDDEIKRLQRDINGQLLQMAKIKDLEADIRPKATGAQRREMSDEERALVRQVNELKRNSKLYTEDEQGLLKTAIGAAMRATANRIRDLRKAMAEGKPITKTQVDLASKDKDLAEQKRILAEVTKDYREMFPRQGATKEQRLAAALRATDREIERVTEQLRTGDFSPRGRAEPVTSAELKAKQAELESLRAQRDAIKAQQNPKMSPQERAEVAYIANLKNRIADYEDRMAHGYFGAKPKKAPLESDEITKHRRRLEEKKEEFFRLAAEWRLSQLSPKERVFDWARETSFLARAIMTSMDLSAVFRQGGPGTFAHPMLAKEAAKEMRRAIFSQEEEFNIAEQMSKHRLYSFAVQAKLEVTASAGRIQNQEEAYMGRWARDGIGKKGTKINKFSKWALTPVAGSARAYTTYLNGLRFRLFTYFVDTLGANGQVTLDEAKAIANFINVSTGRGDFGSYNKVAANLSTVLFAPRYLASRFAYLGLPFYMLQDAKVSGRVKRLIAMEYARHALGVAGFLATAVALGGLLYDDDDEESPTVELDPRSTDFMKLKIGETRIDPLSGFGQIVTFLSQVGLGQKKTMEGEIVDLRGEKKKYGQDSTFDLTANFVRKKLAPIPAAGINIIAGEDVVGNKATVATATTGLFIPLAAREVVETLMARGVPEGPAIAMLNILGMSGGTYGPKTKYKNANAEERKKLIEKDLEAMEWDSKDPGYKDFLTRDELERFKQRREQRKQSLVYSASANPKRKDFQDDTTYAKAVAERDKALKTMVDGKIGPEEARLLLLAYWRRNNKTLYERKGQALVMKDALVERLRQITQKLNQK